MKISRSVAAFFLMALLVAGCNKPKPGSQETPVTSMNDLVVSNDFNWKTTKTVDVNVTLPDEDKGKTLKVYSIDNTRLLYVGYANPNTGNVATKITVPSSYNMVKLVYGSGDQYKPVIAGVGSDMVYNYNQFKSQATFNCDLSGFKTYSQGGWHAKAHGQNGGSVRDAHFDAVFPNGLIAGDKDHFYIRLTTSNDAAAFLPGTGRSKVLTKSYTNPLSRQKVAGNWGGQIVAAILNVKFDKAGFLGTNAQKLGSLVFALGKFEGMSIDEFLVIANKALGGGGLSGYSIQDIQNAAELINLNFDDGKDLGYFTCPHTGGSDDCGCEKGLRTLTLKYNGSSPATIKVKEKKTGTVLFNESVDAGASFSFHGSGNDNKMDNTIYVFVDGVKNTSIHTSCSVNIYKGDVYGDFTIVDGTSKAELHLCEKPTSQCGCEQQLHSLTMRYDGSTAAQIKVKEKKHQKQIFSGTVQPGASFSFTGSGHDGKFDKTLYFYVDGSKNTSLSTKCDNNPTVGNTYGDFTLMAGTSKDNKALCGTVSGGGGTGGTGGTGTTTATTTGTLAYEDLWPAKGDYDFNDLVINYDFAVTKDEQERVQTINATFIVYAFGASYHNGFGFQLPNVSPDQIISATGSDLASNSIINLDPNGLESGQSKATVIVYDDSWRLMPYPGTGIGVNTELSASYVEPDTIVMQLSFYDNGAFATGGAVKYNDLDIGNFNPFIFVNQERGVEVHLPGYHPTDLVNTIYFGRLDDATNAATGVYYKTDKNLPWAINIPTVFEYPIEKQDITQAYLHFADWAQSDGTSFPDWYEDKSGYRNASLIYTHNK